MPIKKYYIESLGCAKNQVDSEIMIAFLEKNNWKLTMDPNEAEVIIVNTCGFIQPAKEESIETVLSFRKLYPGKKIIMTGCLVQRYPGELEELLPEVDGYFGNTDLDKIGVVVESVLNGKKESLIGDNRRLSDTQYSVRRNKLLSFPGSAYIKISEGCDNKCTYCSIPIIRGKLKSRTIRSIVEEAAFLIKNGIRELNVIAQDLASFGRDRGRQEFLDLLRAFSGLKGDFWIRLLYFHPDNFTRDVVELIRQDKRLLPYFDLPFQHASDRVLKKMGRRGNTKKYLDLISWIREKLPDAIIRSTFLVGFPGEREEDFNELLDFQNRARMDWLGVFAYSREEGTPAYHFNERVPKKLAEERKEIIEKLQLPITEKRLDRFINRDLDVLIEEKVEGEDLFIGRAYLDAPEVDGAVVINSGKQLKPGDFKRCRIIDRRGFDLEGVYE